MKILYRTTFHIAWQREPTEDFVFIKDYSKDLFYTLNDVSKDIWMYLVAGKSCEEIIEALIKRYEGAPPEVIEADTRVFIAQCMEQGWIEAYNEGPD